MSVFFFKLDINHNFLSTEYFRQRSKNVKISICYTSGVVKLLIKAFVALYDFVMLQYTDFVLKLIIMFQVTANLLKSKQ